MPLKTVTFTSFKAKIRMKFRSLLKLLFFLTMALNSQISANPDSLAQRGYLKILCEREDVEILLDGKTIGKTPLPVLEVEAGKHNIAALNPARFLWGQFDWQEEIHISPAETLVVQPKFAEVIAFRSHPDGAKVYLNDQFIGETPIYIIKKLTPGTTFILRKKYYFPETVTFDGKYPAFFNIQLSRNVAEFRKYQQLLRSQKTRQTRYRKATFALWTISLLSGMSSIYFKQEANQNYRDYLKTSSLKKMNQYFDDTIKYDNLSNVALGIFQGSLLFSFFTLYKSYR